MASKSCDKSLRQIVVLFLAFLLVSCARLQPVNPTIAANADYGEYPDKYEEIVKDYFSSRLKDPYSAVYGIGKPYKAYLREAPARGGEPSAFGYIVEVGVNAKNSFGGYVGEQYYKLFIRNNFVKTEVRPNRYFPELWYRK